jgi:succinate dehydrogenase/fumarate reductase-like Fe-S protein
MSGTVVLSREEYEQLLSVVKRAIAIAEQAVEEAERYRRLSKRQKRTRVYKCMLCGSVFEDKSLLAQHFEYVHGDVDVVKALQGKTTKEKLNALLAAGLAQLAVER